MKVEAVNGNDTEISIDVGEHLWINTPKGQIMVYVGDSGYNAITTWVNDTHLKGFYTKKTKKQTRPCNEEVDLVSLRPKEAFE